MAGFTLHDLDALIAQRASADAGSSYTRQLLEAGVERCGKKFGEEAFEAVLAAALDDKSGLTKEAADVLYHLLVLLRLKGVPLDEVMAELESRTAQSGLAEKAARRG
ncbi:phosphoribosyl-ATP diphosphatase [Terrihabitans sp. B22-R8]|uniref:phosphoribosyl-ATP diphosphatase n=1 Tax=Terrihabitans sp. B22-R8 TaxID=3425128 RepID=UPI00403CEDCC